MIEPKWISVLKQKYPNPLLSIHMIRSKKIGFHLGYGKFTLNGFYCNNNIMIDQSANIIGRCRKVHLPGHAKFDSSGSSSI
jgi:hypothetical protein